MADYIRKNILCQAYVHLSKDHSALSEEQILESVLGLKEFAMQRSKLFLYEGVETNIDLEEGSIKNRITIFGTIGALYAGIANYSSFRQGISLMYSDAKRFSEYLTSESMFKFNAKANDIIRIEARVGVIGSLYKISASLDSLERQLEYEEDIRKINSKLKSIQNDLNLILKNIKDQEDIKLIKNGFQEQAGRFPSEPRSAKRTALNNKDFAIYDTRRKLLGEILKT